MAEHKRLGLFKREDWRILRQENMMQQGEGITLATGQYAEGYAMLRAIDSGEDGFSWRRASLVVTLPRDSTLRTFARAADRTWLEDGEELEDYLAGLDEGLLAAAKKELFVPVGDGEDFYLPLHGRYLWLCFEFTAAGVDAPLLEGMRLELAGDHMADYLPEIYRKAGDFTKRFLSVFDSVFMDMEDRISQLPGRFDYERADEEMLRYLAAWVSVDARGLSREETITRIGSAFSDYETMFTPEGIRRSVRRLTRREPILIESVDIDPNSIDCVDSDLYRRLYGDNPHRFFILLEEDSFRDRAEMEAFLKHMQGCIPAHTELELILLSQCVQLDKHCYLGVNSVVSNYVPIVLNENMTIHYGTTIGGKNSERD